MPNYSESLLNAIQIAATNTFNAPEFRNTPATATQAVMEATVQDMYVDNLQALKESEKQPTSTYFKQRTRQTVTNTRVANHTGNSSTSVEVPLTYQTYARTYSLSAKQLDGNVYSLAEAMQSEMSQAFLDLHEEINAATLSFLDAQKTSEAQRPNYGRTTFNAVSGTYEIAAANAPQAHFITSQIFNQEYYRGGLIMISDSTRMIDDSLYIEQGPENGTNLRWQYGNSTIFVDPDAEDLANYQNGTYFAYPRGTVGMLEWIPSINRRGHGAQNSPSGIFTTVTDPILGLTYAMHAYEDQADRTAFNGEAQDVQMEFEISVDLSWQRSYESAVGASPIKKVGILS